jgi:hypothetical protein
MEDVGLDLSDKSDASSLSELDINSPELPCLGVPYLPYVNSMESQASTYVMDSTGGLLQQRDVFWTGMQSTPQGLAVHNSSVASATGFPSSGRTKEYSCSVGVSLML